MPEAQSPGRAAALLTASHRALLERVLDMIIPPSPDGRLPGASAVGVPEYLCTVVPEALPSVIAGLEVLQAQAQARHGAGFAALDAASAQALVDDLRRQDRAFLERLALETVTCYYQTDRVRETLEIETRPPAPQGFQVIAGDLMLVEPVRRRGRIWREA